MPNNDTSDDDNNLFRESMRWVTPLKKQNKVTLKPERAAIIPPLRSKIQFKPIQTCIALSNNYFDEVSAESVLSYSLPNLPKKSLLDLRKGNVQKHCRLDLHGLTTPQAHDKLCQFITQKVEAGHRYALIIHGKGSSKGEAPVLKNHVNHWLKQLPQVLAFHSAIARDGGNGALYVWLKNSS